MCNSVHERFRDACEELVLLRREHNKLLEALSKIGEGDNTNYTVVYHPQEPGHAEVRSRNKLVASFDGVTSESEALSLCNLLQLAYDLGILKIVYNIQDLL